VLICSGWALDGTMMRVAMNQLILVYTANDFLEGDGVCFDERRPDSTGD